MVSVTIDGQPKELPAQTYSMRDLASHLGLNAETISLTCTNRRKPVVIGGNDSFQVFGGESFTSAKNRAK